MSPDGHMIMALARNFASPVCSGWRADWLTQMLLVTDELEKSSWVVAELAMRSKMPSVRLILFGLRAALAVLLKWIVWETDSTCVASEERCGYAAMQFRCSLYCIKCRTASRVLL